MVNDITDDHVRQQREEFSDKWSRFFQKDVVPYSARSACVQLLANLTVLISLLIPGF